MVKSSVLVENNAPRDCRKIEDQTMRLEPVLSVICVTYNHEKYIADAVDGFLMQKTTFPIEIIVGEDCSTDGTLEILKRYDDERLNIIARPKNIGGRNNMLDLISRSTGKYTTWCEGDDYWVDPLKLQKQVDFLEANPDYSICFHPVKMFWEDNSQYSHTFPPVEFPVTTSLEDLTQSNFILACSPVYRSYEGFLKEFGDYIVRGDYFRSILNAERGLIGFIPQVMGCYRRHPEGAWYNTNADNVEFWAKYGLVHLGLFKYMDSKKFKRNYKDALLVVCINTLNAFIKLNDKEAIAKFRDTYPEYYDLIMSEQQTTGVK
jgi:glycosyltransferase involved in cell wall biosynthesis